MERLFLFANFYNILIAIILIFIIINWITLIIYLIHISYQVRKIINIYKMNIILNLFKFVLN